MKPSAFSPIASKLPHTLWGSFLLLCALASCMDEEEYSVSASDRLVFSVDTVQLDTVISGQATNTHTFQVYNPGDKALRIPRVYLESGSASSYRVNVDGTFLENGEGADFEISGGDSLRVFLFLNAPDRDQDTPVAEIDRLHFVTEAGVDQNVVLNAYGQSVIALKGKVLSQDTLLDARRPYQVLDSLYVGKDATLQIAPGVTLLFHPNAHLIVDGKVKAEGTVDAPIVMRGDRLGYMFSQQPYDRIPGQWGGIILRGSSFGNHFNWCDIHSGTTGIRCDSSAIDTEKLRLENSIVHNMSQDALLARSARIFVGNSQITNAGGDCVFLQGGYSEFVHCTIGNFYAFAGGRGIALRFTNQDGDIRLPLEKAAFYNCIVTGYSDDEMMGEKSDRYENDAFNYLFSNCLLNTPEYESEAVRQCLWDNEDHEVSRDKNFHPNFDFDQLIFTFGLSKASQAVNAADRQITQEYYPNDRNGRSRSLDDGPDIGCYEADLEALEQEEQEQKTKE